MAKRSNGIQDAGVPLVVDPFTRRVTVPATERVIGVVGDHCSEQVTFQIPRKIDNHDMTTSTRRYVAWRNVDGEPGTDELAITESTEDHILLGWTVRDRLTMSKGLVAFSLHFECWGKDEKGKEKRVYKWGTHTCSTCEILDAVNAINSGGAYDAIYIDGETLVFADYTPVADEKIDLTSCVLPKDTLEIKEAGTHDVGRYAYAVVEYEAPTITVEAGVVKAEANGLEATEPLGAPVLSVAKDGTVTARAYGLETSRPLPTFDQDGVFIKANIRKGVSIFGVTGTLEQGLVPEYVTVDVGLLEVGNTGLGAAIYYQALDASVPSVKKASDYGAFDTFKGAMVVVTPPSTHYLDVDAESTTLEGVTRISYSYAPGAPLVLQVTGDNPKIYMSYKIGG